MRRFLIAILPLVAFLGPCPVHASVCNASASANEAAGTSLSIDHYITDATLHRRWAVIVDCHHPDRPWILQTAQPQIEKSTPYPPQLPVKHAKAVLVIRTGGEVRLWRNADGASIDLSGTALEPGSIGQTIHVRTGQRSAVLEGKVRGAGSVELLVSDHWQDKGTDRWSAQ